MIWRYDAQLPFRRAGFECQLLWSAITKDEDLEPDYDVPVDAGEPIRLR
jgi:hypothetical protein